MAQNKRQLKKEEKKVALNALSSLVSSGTVAEMLFKQATESYKKEIPSNKEISSSNINKSYEATVESFNNITSSLNNVIKIFKGVQNQIAEKITDRFEERKKLEYAIEERAAIPIKKERPTITDTKQEELSTTELLKDFLTNPAIVAAFSGLIYLFLPKEIKDKISAFFTGFKEGIEGTNKELDTFKIALMTAVAGLATYLGASVLKSVAEAITTTVSLIAKAKTAFGRLGKAGKIAVGAAVIGAAAVGGVAVAGTGRKEDREKDKREDQQPALKAGTVEEMPSPAITAPSQKIKIEKLPESKTEERSKGINEAAGTGVKPGAKTGLTMPTGSDADIKKMIINHEGIRYKPYKDSLGLWTVGVGHLIGDGKTLPPEYDRTFSHEEVMKMFDKDYEHHKAAAERIPGFDNMNEKGEAALIDLTFNMGPAWYKKWPNFTKSLEQGDTEAAAKNLESSKWYTQVGRRAPTIVSLIRTGGEEDQSKVGAIPSMQPQGQGIKVASLEPSSSSLGAKVAAASEQSALSVGVEQPSVTNNSLNASRQISTKKGPDAPPPIPSPIADRGTLAIGSSHSTSYVG